MAVKKKAAAKKAVVKKAAAKKAPAKKPAARKTAARKAPARKAPARKAPKAAALKAGKPLAFKFHGDGLDFFLLSFGNQILSLLTLGIYAAWGRAKSFKYQYGMTEFAGQRFRFHGTGGEIFKGFMIALLVFGGLYAVLIAGAIAAEKAGAGPLFGLLQLGFVLAFVFLVELAYFRSRAYRASRLTWSGVAFRLEGSAKDFAKEMLWRRMVIGFSFFLLAPNYYHFRRLRTYENMRYGHLEFGYDADLEEYRQLCFKGFLLTLVTLGIYSFWWMPALLRFHLNHITLAGRRFKFEMSQGDYIRLLISNLAIVLFSLGLAAPFAVIRAERFMCERLSLAIPPSFLMIKNAGRGRESAAGEAFEDMADAGFDWGF